MSFEYADVSGFAAGSQIPIERALPGWTASYASSLGATTVTSVWYGNPGPGGRPQGPVLFSTNLHQATLEGTFTLLLQPRFDVSTASISQTGTVPDASESLRFRVSNSTFGINTNFTVTLGGEALVVRRLGGSLPGQYSDFGADISAFTGQTAELSFVTNPMSSVELDAIEFSPLPIPEPSLAALLSLSLVLIRGRLQSRP